VARPLISICIPAYNRSDVLPDLLDSIIWQDFGRYEIVVCEDNSPEREKIRAVVASYVQKVPGIIRYLENPTNLGYDANLRTLVREARGEYCLFMGNDDLLAANALTIVASNLTEHKGIGVLLRSYASFEGSPENIIQTFRYFDERILFPPGAKTITTLFRRSVVISGMVVHRDTSLQWETDRFDGTLLYQLYLVATALVHMKAVYVPDVIALYRTGGIPDFGSSEAEKGKFTPQQKTVNSSIQFMRGMLEIARYVQENHSVAIYEDILRDVSNYSYPILAIQADRSVDEFGRYKRELGRLGLKRHIAFHVWFYAIRIFGTRLIDRFISLTKQLLGHTPSIGKVYRGEKR
jgi:abequosyltransferase